MGDSQRRVGTRRLLWALALVPVLFSCATVQDVYRLENEIARIKRGGSGAPDRLQVADQAEDLDALRQQLAELQGRFEVVEHQVGQALKEARAARLEASGGMAGAATDPGAEAGGGSPASPGLTGDSSATGAAEGSYAEVQAYREAHEAWREDQHDACIDRFGEFLQTYPSSAYADDSAYWLADCFFKQGDLKTAILRFDDVVARFPTGNRAADALYRQGEALLRLGPGYSKAAGKAFERVLQEYPDSARVADAKRQLSLMGSG